jgi:hypothetical protein
VVTENQGKGRLILPKGNIIYTEQISHPKYFDTEERNRKFLRISCIHDVTAHKNTIRVMGVNASQNKLSSFVR